MAISNAMSTSMISASNSMKIAKIQKGVKSSMDGHAGVLKAEIAALLYLRSIKTVYN